MELNNMIVDKAKALLVSTTNAAVSPMHSGDYTYHLDHCESIAGLLAQAWNLQYEETEDILKLYSLEYIQELCRLVNQARYSSNCLELVGRLKVAADYAGM